MKQQSLFGVVAFIGALVVATTSVMSQDKGAKPEEEQMQAWTKFAAPGEFHAHLQPLVGKWKQNVKWWMAPGVPPSISTGTCEYKWVVGKRFLLQEIKGEMESGPFEGLGLIGYDNFKKKYTSMWVDNMGTVIMTSLGTCDDSGKVFTLTGAQDDVFTGKPNQPFKTITRIINNNTHIFEMYMNDPDGKEFKVLEITYTRT